MKRFRSIIVLVACVVIVGLGVQCKKSTDDRTAQAGRNKTSSKVVDVDELVRRPDDFKGAIGVTGTVVQLEESTGTFVLGCKDACVALPVTFKGKIPAVGTKVTVYGEVTKVEGEKYIFAAREVKPR